MILRVLTETNFLDIELKEKISEQQLIQALENMSTLMVKTNKDTLMFINPVNVVALELIDTPPIQ